MTYPYLEIDLKKISHNIKVLKNLYNEKFITLMGVTKGICGDPHIAKLFTDADINIIADTKIENIIRMKKSGINAVYALMRTSVSSAEDIVKYTDISLNSELAVISEISKKAIAQKKKHKIIIMIELGDLREGVLPSNIDAYIEKIIKMSGIYIAGIGANFGCMEGLKPDRKNMQVLSEIAKRIRRKHGLKLEYISGGNSANYNWYSNCRDIGEINNLRIGDSIYLGKETLDDKPIPGLFTDAFKLFAEVIELKVKQSSVSMWKNKKDFKRCNLFSGNNKDIKRAILGIGIQDVLVQALICGPNIEIIGVSSDHTIINANNINVEVGDSMQFGLRYKALMTAMASPYIRKVYI